MANNICTSVIANMATMRSCEVKSVKIKIYKTYTDTMLFTTTKKTAATIIINNANKYVTPGVSAVGMT